MTAGALLALGQLLHTQPARDVEQTTDRVTEDLLRMFGVPDGRRSGSPHCRCRTSTPCGATVRLPEILLRGRAAGHPRTQVAREGLYG